MLLVEPSADEFVQEVSIPSRVLRIGGGR